MPRPVKRITKTTFGLGVLQAVLGVTLYAVVYSGLGTLVEGAINFLHVATAIAIITQASSSATAFDMWEEKEFVQPPAAPSTETSRPAVR